eukprot:6468971-Amphidinium_carterae.1
MGELPHGEVHVLSQQCHLQVVFVGARRNQSWTWQRTELCVHCGCQVSAVVPGGRKAQLHQLLPHTAFQGLCTSRHVESH